MVPSMAMTGVDPRTAMTGMDHRMAMTGIGQWTMDIGVKAAKQHHISINYGMNITRYCDGTMA